MKLLTALAATAAIALPVAAYQASETATPAEAATQGATQLGPMVMTTPGDDEAPGAVDKSQVTAGTYEVDPGHTLVTFTVDHLGFSSYTGQFGNPSGTLVLDPANPTEAELNVSFPISAVSTTSEQLDEHLQSEDFFNAAEYPEATFTATDIFVEGNNAGIRGNLSMAGVTKSVVLQAQFYGAGTNPMSGEPNIGFRATTSINRSDWGIDYALPALSDEVLLVIDAAFVKQGDGAAAPAPTEDEG
ncbi:hypothetical protein B5C34_13190 [Pacificimonas flava]|uniref:Lipid/polyisoprenoid-binding YceI-like domain-containing protein n=2 Tax=Pacificimonas TaxID=1960290 RepID=A0A219B969_9SPHN|nr:MULTISPECIES: YceI family protein [Pacificimonas]MBZ6378376.1 polyisoprenoid-binding protein [Pacificimonas aurantium]OWV34318.1 hypothetical protein B5C34_13190 [Pacificimonas flava]